MKDHSDSEDYSRAEANIAELFYTNNDLISRKKYRITKKLNKYDEKIEKVREMMEDAKQSEMQYLYSCLQSLVNKRNQTMVKAERVRQIELELDTFKESFANLDTRPRESEGNQRQSSYKLLKFGSLYLNRKEIQEVKNNKAILLDELRELYVQIDDLTEIVTYREAEALRLKTHIDNERYNIKKLRYNHRRFTQQMFYDEAKLKKIQDDIFRAYSQLKTTQLNTDRVKNDTVSEERRKMELQSYIYRIEQSKFHCQNQLKALENKIEHMSKKCKYQEDTYKLNESQYGNRIKTLEERCHELYKYYEKMLYNVAELKEEEAEALARLEETEDQLGQETYRNDKLVEEDRYLQKIIEEKYGILERKLKETQELEEQLVEYEKHKEELLGEFELIEVQKCKLFTAVNYKYSEFRQLYIRKVQSYERLNKMELEMHRYQKIFNDVNDKIEEYTRKIGKLENQEKEAIEMCRLLQYEYTGLQNRILELQNIMTKLCIVNSLIQPSDYKLDARIKSRVEDMMSRLQCAVETEKALQQEKVANRKLRLENDNLKALVR